MGFKRTSEGRVFFQGADATANDEPRGSSQQAQQTQLQILTLLKALNEKLKSSQMERKKMRKELDAYRTLVEDLGSKAEHGERVYMELEQKLRGGQYAEGRAANAEKLARETLKELGETRKLLLELEDKTDRADSSVSSMKMIQQEQAQRMARAVAGYAQLTKRVKETEEKQTDLSGKVEDTISQQSRLVRKVDKAVEDRARFMRKIERIEETVIQTRDSLNAKAMVLLTEQGAAGGVGLQDPDDAGGIKGAVEKKLQTAQGYEDMPFWSKPLQVQPAALASVAVVLVVGGWLFSQAVLTRAPSLGMPGVVDTSQYGLDGRPLPVQRQLEPPQGRAEQDWRVERDTSAFSEVLDEAVSSPSEGNAPASAVETEVIDDIGTLLLEDEEKVLAALESNPDAVAAALNRIEPGTIQTEDITRAEPEPEEAVREARLTTQDKTPEQPVRQETPKKSTPTEQSKPVMKSRPDQISLSPDPDLKGRIKELETRAFEGIPEDQHDLAAVYTAGHAGVQQNYEKAAYWFRKAADQGIANAAYNLGVLHHQGLGTTPDIDEAIYWYTTAADLGHPEAQYNLGIAYIEGIGVSYNPVKASQYFESAAKSGVMEAAYNLGLIHENALLGQAKPDEALMWYKIASDRGSPEAKAALEQLARTLNIKIEDVNRLAESMKVVKMGQANPPAVKEPSANKKVVQNKAPPPAPTQVPEKTENQERQIVYDPPGISDVGDGFSNADQQQILVAQVQEYLVRIGLYPGPADGVIGPLTGDAIRSYQALNNLHVNGQVSEDLLTHMLANGIESASEDVGSREQ